jgi:hypothetical protein
MKFINWVEKLIKNNSGISSKNFFLVVVTFIGCILLIVPAIILVTEVIFTHTIATDLNGMAAYIGAVASLFATAGLTKAWSEKFEKPHHGHGHEHHVMDSDNEE